MKRVLVVAILGAMAATLSCHVNDYCLNCETGDGGGSGSDAGDGDANDGGGDAGDAGDAGPCVPTGPEVCDNKDNDCDGNVDEAPLPDIGTDCANQTGECSGAKTQCVAGAVTCTKSPSPEVCDGKDNDCNGLTDEGDPGGGAKCGTDVGECVAGTFHCNLTTHVVECIGAVGSINGQPEQCNGRDDDCDGNFDEGLGSLGSCGGGPGVDPNAGECQQGTLMCVGGGSVCVNDTGPTFEACDNKDNDCDGSTDEDTNKATDPQNCGTCGHVCNLAHAFEGCAGGNCTIAACETGFHNNNNITGDGCEFGPCTIQGNEVCNGVDDDCNGATDDGLTPPPNFCLTAGACAGATATCQGANGFRCTYGPDVSQDANGNVVAEVECDGIDNDCDGKVDEGQPNLGQACGDNGVGACHGTGTFQCDPANTSGPAVCVITSPGATPAAESCDGKDNDCDGIVDDGANTGNLPGQDWISIPGGGGKQIMKWEASRPDATASAIGTSGTFACSKQGVQPWTNITAPQALAACQSIGARLCTETEWQSMCSQPVGPTYPMAAPTTATDHVFIEAEQAFANTPVAGRTWSSVPTQNFSGTTSLQAQPDADSISRNNAPTQATRLDFQFSLAASTSYFLWLRVFAPNSNGNTVHVGLNTTTPGSASQTLTLPITGQWVWIVSTALPSTTAGNYLFSVYMSEGGLAIDAITVSRDGVNPPPQDDKIWAFQTNNKVPQTTTCNGNEFDTNSVLAGDQDDILPTGSRPQCFANGPGTADVFDMSGNVKEWTAPRAAGQNPLRGGASNNAVNGLTCQLNFTLADDAFFFPNVGFRCCR